MKYLSGELKGDRGTKKLIEVINKPKNKIESKTIDDIISIEQKYRKEPEVETKESCQ